MQLQPGFIGKKGDPIMRHIMLAFLILSPFIAIAQNYHLQPIATAPAPHLAQVVVNSATAKMSNMVHAVQALLT
jgi:hypothetical protein